MFYVGKSCVVGPVLVRLGATRMFLVRESFDVMSPRCSFPSCLPPADRSLGGGKCQVGQRQPFQGEENLP